jgi:hypothetical protein
VSNKFTWENGDVQISQCASCRWKNPSGATCRAFPKAIPIPILMNQADHTQPYPDDNGIQYEKREDAK